MFMAIAIIVQKLCTVKVETLVNAQSAPFCQIRSHMIHLFPHYIYYVIDVTVENVEPVSDATIAERQESGSPDFKTDPPLRYSFSMLHLQYVL